jgi:hypothetical protein
MAILNRAEASQEKIMAYASGEINSTSSKGAEA